jgi:hypothetical protein
LGISGVEGKGNGVQLALSKDSLAKTKDILKKCGNDDNKCFNDVYNLIQGTELQFDSKVERRTLLAKVSKTIKWNKGTPIALFILVTDYLRLSWKEKSGELDNGGFNFPAIIASQADEAAKATAVTVSAGGKAFATHKPPPQPPTPVQG